MIIKFNKNGTFQYFLPYVDEKVIGKWRKEKNVLILESEFFEEKDNEQFPTIYQFTAGEKVDIYKIKGNKLYILSANGDFTDKCFFKIIKKNN